MAGAAEHRRQSSARTGTACTFHALLANERYLGIRAERLRPNQLSRWIPYAPCWIFLLSAQLCTLQLPRRRLRGIGVLLDARREVEQHELERHLLRRHRVGGAPTLAGEGLPVRRRDDVEVA